MRIADPSQMSSLVNESADAEARLAQLAERLHAHEIARAELILRHHMELTGIRDRHRAEKSSFHKSIRDAEESVRARFVETAALTKMVLDLEQQLASGSRALQDAREQSRQITSVLQARIAKMDEELADAVATCRALECESELLRRRIAEHSEDLQIVKKNALRKWRSPFARTPGPEQDAVPAEVVPLTDLVRRSGLLDSDWYLKRYPDVRDQDMDPVDHYLLHGAAERRDPGPGFSTALYLARYPDVEACAINPLVHYLKYGLREGRSARSPTKPIGAR